jgi:hypothetical protein
MRREWEQIGKKLGWMKLMGDMKEKREIHLVTSIALDLTGGRRKYTAQVTLRAF